MTSAPACPELSVPTSAVRAPAVRGMNTARRAEKLGDLPTPIIDAFIGPHEFLSNVWPALTSTAVAPCPSSEHAYATAKTDDHDVILRIAATDDAAEAKAIARSAPLVEDGEHRKFAYMEPIVDANFRSSRGSELRSPNRTSRQGSS